MFTKIESTFIKSGNVSRLVGDLVTEFVSGTVHLRYFSISDFDLFRQMHSRNIFGIKPETVLISTLSGVGVLGCHRDHNVRVSLNHYVSASEDVTSFYNVKQGAVARRYREKEEANVYDVADVEYVDGFIARSGDSYLLDVSQVHSVSKTSSVDRVFIAYGWNNYSYDEILASLK